MMHSDKKRVDKMDNGRSGQEMDDLATIGFPDIGRGAGRGAVRALCITLDYLINYAYFVNFSKFDEAV